MLKISLTADFIFYFLKYLSVKVSIELAIPKRPEVIMSASLSAKSPTANKTKEIKIIYVSPFIDPFDNASVKVRIKNINKYDLRNR